MRFFTKTELRIFLIFWVIFSIFITSDSWVDNSSLALTRAIVDEHRLEIDSYVNNTGDRVYYNGHYYSDRVPGAALLAVPVYTAYKFFFGEIPNANSIYEINPSWKYYLFLFLVNSLISAVFATLTIILVYRISKYFTSNKTHRNLIIIVLGLGTLLLHAGRNFNSHAPSTFFIFLCFYLVFKMKKENKDYSFIAGISGGLAVLMEYRIIIILAGIFIMVLISKKLSWILKFILGVLMFYSLLLSYDYIVYGSPFDDSYGKIDQSVYQPIRNNLTCSPLPLSFEYTTTFQAMINTIKIYFLYPVFLKLNMIKIIRLLFDPFRGLFFYYPIMLLSFVGLFFVYKKYKLESLIILICFFVYLFQVTSTRIWWHGPCFGPRHLTPFIPFFIIPLFYVFKKLNIKIILFFIIISILINIIGLQPIELSHAFPGPEPFEKNLYCERIYSSFIPLANPVFEDYIPSLLNYNNSDPEPALISEQLLGFKIIPFANIIIMIVAFLLIWKNKSIFGN